MQELIGMAMRTVSLMSSSQLYGLQMPRDNHNLTAFRHILCRNLTWAEIKKLYNPTELTLAICLYPTKFEEAARNDRSTLFYLHQQAKEIYYAHFKDITDVAMAFEIGCLDIRSFATSADPCTKDLLDVLDKGRGLHSFFPPCVLHAYKNKALRRAVQNYLVKVQHYSEEDCALDMLNRYLILLKFDRDVIKCSFGAGHGFPVELVIGPRFQVSILIENANEPRTVAYFASIKRVMVSKTVGPDGVRYQVRLAIEQSSDPNAPLEIMTFNFHTQEAADTVVHLLEGYCGEAIGAAMQDNVSEFGTATSNRTSRASRDSFLPNGCPYRLKETPTNEMQKLEMPRESVLLEQVLGEGQFGDVYKGIYRKNHHSELINVAVKTCKIDASTEERSQFLEEAQVVLQNALFGPAIDGFELLTGSRVIGLQYTDDIALLGDDTQADQHASNRLVIEVSRDIAARNILVARADWVKLADFGMARMLNDANEFRADKGRKMPIKWMAPESVHHRRFSSASDVWMFGVCMWEILSGGTKPFADMTNAEAAEHVTRGQRLKRPETCPRNLYVVMLECWNTNPQRRPTFAALKPRLRELAAQSRDAAKSDYLNSGKVSPTRKSRSAAQHHHHHTHSGNRKQEMPGGFQNNSSTAKLPSVHSRWDEVTELEPTDRGALSDGARFETSRDIILSGTKKQMPCSTNASESRRAVCGNSIGSSRSMSVGNTHRTESDLSPQERDRLHTTHLETNISGYTRSTTAGQSRLRSAPNISRDPSPKRNVTSGYEPPQSIGASVRDLFAAIEVEFGTSNVENEIFLAERQLNASMYHLISTIKDAKLSINRGPLLEEYRRHLLTLSYAIAADAHSLYTAVHESRNRLLSSRQSAT
ncbi:unnamed protein product [Echinostoma caproni]|uniref:Non-specific protein-tyrosine kinase n=1 Tax=Echinostoma caproni TaxID=27848 RepID=A0A183A6F3_9TREM|nr:unnamed protein product [Echinostoma caproni]